MLLLPAILINKPYDPKHVEFCAIASISKPLTNWPQSLLVVFLVKPHPILYLWSMGLLGTGIMTSLLLACHNSIGRALHWHCSLRSRFESHSGLSCYYKSGIKNCEDCTIHDLKMSTIIKGEWTIVTLFFEEALLLNFVFFGINLRNKFNVQTLETKIPINRCLIFDCSHPM